MKIFFRSLVLFFIVFTSCKTTKTMIDANAMAKNISARKVAKKHIAANFEKISLDAKLKVNFNNGKTKQSLSVSMKIKKDEVIWIKGSKLITVFKAKITPTSVSYYSPLGKNYFTGDFSMIKNLLGVEINFEQLQNLFLGQSLKNVTEEKQEVEIENNTYILSPENQNLMYDIFYAISPSHFKLDHQILLNSDKNLRLDIKYPSYNMMDDEVFPSQVNIKAQNSKSTTTIDLIYKSVVFDTEVGMNFRIPSGYKSLKF